jgi:hypothetical protein
LQDEQRLVMRPTDRLRLPPSAKALLIPAIRYG